MALFRLTTKRLMTNKGKRLEAGMTAEVSYNGSAPLAAPATRTEIQRQFKVKYNVDFPMELINPGNFEIVKL